MEVTPELYGWLINLNIIDMNKSTKLNNNSKSSLNDDLIDQLLKGKYFDRILNDIQEGYNMFYKINLKYTEKLKNLKEIKGNDILGIYNNWKTISDILINFGIEIDEEKIKKLSQGDRQTLINILKTIFTLGNEMLKRSVVKEVKEAKEAKEVIEIHKSNDNLESTKNNQNKTKNNNKKISQPMAESIDLNSLNPDKDYSKCESPLEFFIVSLCKAFQMKPRQAVALLSNNRKYLIHIANKGIKGDYSKLINFYEDISANLNLLINLLQKFNDGKSISFAILSSGLYSKDLKLVQLAHNLLNRLEGDIGIDWDWFTKEGLDTLIFAINKHINIRISLINLIYEFSKKKIDEFIKILTNKLSEKDKLFEFLSSIVTHLHQTHTIISNKLKNFLFEKCLSENLDMSVSISILSDAWINFSPIENQMILQIINYMKKCIRDKSYKNSQFTSIIQLFRLMSHFAEIKNNQAPQLYKTLVFLFLENYDNILLREIFLINFIQFFKSDTKIPINILLDPYLRQLKIITNYNLIDFQFIIQILDHARITNENIKEILEFNLQIALTNINFSRTANLILHILFDKNLINNESLFSICIQHIKQALGYFIQHVKSNFIDVVILETPYDLVSMNISEINENVKEDIIETVKFFRGEINYYSSALLALLFTYEEHDEVLLNLEEKYAERYEPVEISILKRNKEKEAKAFNKKVIDKIRQKKLQDEILIKEELIRYKIRETKIKKHLEKELQQKSFELGKLNSSQNDTSNINKTLIIKEGSFIENSLKNPIGKNKENPYKNFILPILLEDEETREKIAIEGMIKQYKKKINFYFNSYMTEVDNTITKSNVLKLFRENGIGNDLLTLEELTISIRNVFSSPLNNFTKEKFVDLIIQLGFLIFTKIKRNWTISECFEKLLQRFDLRNENNNSEYKNVIRILKEKMNLENDNSYEDILIPGIKKIKKTKVLFNYKLPENFSKFLTEGKINSIEILNEIILKITSSNIIEPLVQIKKENDLVLDTNINTSKKWSPQIILSFSQLEKSLQKESVEVADLLEDMLKNIDKGRSSLDKPQIVTPMMKIEIENLSKFSQDEKRKEKSRKLRKQIIDKQLEEELKKKEEEKLKREEETKKIKLEKENKLKEQLLKERKIRRQLQEKIKLAKVKKEEEKSNKEKEEKEKREESEKKKNVEKQTFFKKQKRRLKDQFTVIKNIKQEIVKKQNEIIQATYKLPSIDIKKVIDKDKSVLEFEKKLNEKMEALMKQPEINSVFLQFQDHLKIIFDIYYKLGSKISSYIDDKMYLNEFKEFCLNFTILPLLISKDQMIYIFRKISKKNELEKTEHFYIRFKDFILSILYLCVMSKFTNKSRKILSSDLAETNQNIVKNFFAFLGLNLPFNKREVEDFINDRRALSAKQLSKLQKQIKNSLPKEESKNKEEEKKINKSLLRNNFLKKKEEKLVEVNLNKLENNSGLKIINPDGNTENWEVVKNK